MRVQFNGLHDASTSTQLPPGKYAFEIDSVDAEYKSQEKQTEGMEVKMHVIEGMDFDDGSSTVGLQRTLRLWYPNPSQKDGGKFCMGRLNEFVQACGVDTGDDGFDADDLVGKRFMCRCKIKAGEKGDNEEFDKFASFE